MDLLSNEQKRINLRWLGEYAWGKLETRAYHPKPSSTMDFGADKQFQYSTAPGMPIHRRQNHRRHGQSGNRPGRAQPCCAWAANTSYYAERLVAGLRHRRHVAIHFHQYQRRPAQPPGAVW